MDKPTIELLRWILELVIIPIGVWLVRMSIAMSVVQNDVKWIKESFSLMGKKSARTLHGPHTPALDDLLEKYAREEITYTEVERLVCMLEEIENTSDIPVERKISATQLLSSIAVRYKIIAQ